MKKDLINKLKELEKKYNFNYVLTDKELDITDEYGRSKIYIFNINMNNKTCISYIMFLLNRFDFSYLLEFGNCEELKKFIKLN